MIQDLQSHPAIMTDKQKKLSASLADRFDAMANAMSFDIANKRRAATQGYTPKRAREEASRRIEADHLERCQRALRELAALHRTGCIPSALADFKTKAQILDALHTRIDTRGGYYSVRDTGEYRDNSFAATWLQSIIEPKNDDDKAAALAKYKADQLRLKLETLRGSNIDGFFPTPAALASRMVKHADIQPLDSVLEPSAGIGSLADAVRASQPAADITCVEVHHSLADVLLYKDYSIVRADFLQWAVDCGETFDRIVMNPPFEHCLDAAHIVVAWRLLKPGGRLVALCAANACTKTGRAGDALRETINGGDVVLHERIENAFDSVDSFRRTGVAVDLLVIEKPLGG